MAEFANVIAVAYKGGSPTVDVVCALLKGIDNAARNGNADFGLSVTVAYTSANQTFETLSSGRVSIKSTALGAQIDNRTVAVTLSLTLGATPPPGGSPSYSATAQITHRDAASGADVELGPAEQTFP